MNRSRSSSDERRRNSHASFAHCFFLWRRIQNIRTRRKELQKKSKPTSMRRAARTFLSSSSSSSRGRGGGRALVDELLFSKTRRRITAAAAADAEETQQQQQQQTTTETFCLCKQVKINAKIRKDKGHCVYKPVVVDDIVKSKQRKEGSLAKRAHW